MPAATVIRLDAAGWRRPASLPGWRVCGSRQGTMEDCCLIVATYNRPHEAGALLEALCDRDDVPGEVVIADGSPHPMLELQLKNWLRGRVLKFDLVYVKCPAGLTRQRNIGIDISTREFVFFLDDDSSPLNDYFRHVRAVFLSDEAGQVGAVGGSVVNELDRPIPRRWRFRLMSGLVPRVDPMTYDSCGTSTPKGLSTRFTGVRAVDILPGCGFTFRREVFKSHRFSAFFDGYSQGEDLEMSLRVKAGWKVVCCGDAELLHCPATAGRPPSFSKGRMEVRNRFFIWKRHRPDTRWIDRTRFWLDIALLVAFDIGHMARRPWRPASLLHAAGLLSGAVACLLHPPRFTEPSARREYRLADKAYS